ncbi:hypothetical protein Tco_0299785 [Tanacetum coccineum]
MGRGSSSFVSEEGVVELKVPYLTNIHRMRSLFHLLKLLSVAIPVIQGVYDALQKKYFKTRMFCVREIVDGEMIEEYLCKIPNSICNINEMTVIWFPSVTQKITNIYIVAPRGNHKGEHDGTMVDEDQEGEGGRKSLLRMQSKLARKINKPNYDIGREDSDGGDAHQDPNICHFEADAREVDDYYSPT